MKMIGPRAQRKKRHGANAVISKHFSPTSDNKGKRETGKMEERMMRHHKKKPYSPSLLLPPEAEGASGRVSVPVVEARRPV